MSFIADLPKIIKPGDRVRHFNTRQYGIVLEVIPQRDGSAELRILRDPSTGTSTGEGQWATYHIDQHQPGRAS